MCPTFEPEIWLPLAIIFSSFISEDGATGFAALLATQGKLGTGAAFASACLGIWIGDIGLFAVSRSIGSAWLPRVRQRSAMENFQNWFEQHGLWVLVLARFVPGTRFLTYVAAGATRIRPVVFALVTGVSSLLWVGLFFVITYKSRFLTSGLAPSLQIGIGSGALLGLYLLLKRYGASLSRRLPLLSHWEFWPAWLFYAPVALMCVWLGIKYRGFALPSAANPAQRNGGIIGESKIDILDEIRLRAPALVASAYLIPVADPRQRVHFLEHIVSKNGLSLPLVLKPNTAQRGAGFCKLTRWEDAEIYFAAVRQEVVAQEYVTGPHEAGIFYYRLPGEEQGKIFSITHKEFPVVVGDGRSTLEELILADARAALIATTYLNRFPKERDQVLPAGAAFRLVEAGNHCQGCIFRSGAHLLTPALEQAIDQIARKLPEFFIGRFDIRYSSADELKSGVGFKIIELNGAASEATEIYDPGNSLFDAYRTLYEQWDLVYRIGSRNRSSGVRGSSLLDIAADWLRYQRQAANYPAAD